MGENYLENKAGVKAQNEEQGIRYRHKTLLSVTSHVVNHVVILYICGATMFVAPNFKYCDGNLHCTLCFIKYGIHFSGYL